MSRTDSLFDPADIEMTPEGPRIKGLPEAPPIAAQQIPKDLRAALAKPEQTTPCGMPYVIFWRGGPAKGLPLSVYCTSATMTPTGAPGCIQTGRCVGPTFVPHVDQFTSPDPEDPMRRRRKITPGEILAGVRFAADKARKITGVADRRSDREAAAWVATIWQRTLRSLRGEGEWTAS